MTNPVHRQHELPGAKLGDYLPDVEAAMVDLQRRDVIDRIWRYDHTVWKPDPTELANRLGWLTVTGTMAEQASSLRDFAGEITDAGFRHPPSAGPLPGTD